jgi:hypothetical protein
MIAGAWVTFGKYPSRNVTEPEPPEGVPDAGELDFEELPQAPSTNAKTTKSVNGTRTRRGWRCSTELSLQVSRLSQLTK